MDYLNIGVYGLGILGHTDRPLSLRYRILLVAFRVCDPVYLMTCPAH